MILLICAMICAIVLWYIGDTGLRNYQYDHEIDMKNGKILNNSVLGIFILLLILKFFFPTW